MFDARHGLCQMGRESSARTPKIRCRGREPLRALEHLSKAALFHCKDCGDCSLPEIAYLCPESQCAKNQRNGPCGGTREGRCEVDGYGDCIWLRAYERLKHDGARAGDARPRACCPESRRCAELRPGRISGSAATTLRNERMRRRRRRLRLKRSFRRNESRNCISSAN